MSLRPLNRVHVSVAVVAVVAVLCSGQCGAATINLSTGLDASDNLISSCGVDDAHWTVQQLNGTTWRRRSVRAAPTGGFLGAQRSELQLDRQEHRMGSGSAGYSFYREFDLSQYDLSTVSITGLWNIDDAGSLKINGVEFARLSWCLQSEACCIPSPLPTQYLNQGLNTLSITMDECNEFVDAVRLEATVTGELLTEACCLPAGGCTMADAASCSGQGVAHRRGRAATVSRRIATAMASGTRADLCDATSQQAKLTALDAHNLPGLRSNRRDGRRHSGHRRSETARPDRKRERHTCLPVWVAFGCRQAKLTASDAAVGDYFGSPVAVDGDTVVVGAPDADLGLSRSPAPPTCSCVQGKPGRSRPS